MEKKNSIFIITIIILALIILVLSGLLISNKVSTNSNDSTQTENSIKKENDTDIEKAPKLPNKYFENLLEPYSFVPENFEINNIDDEFLTQFVINYYTIYDDTYKENATHDATKTKSNTIVVPKEEVSGLIEEYFNIKNKNLNNYNSDERDIQVENNNYIISYISQGYDLANEKIISTDYNDNYVNVNYELLNPYTDEIVGNKFIRLKYENNKFNIVSYKVTITSKNW